MARIPLIVHLLSLALDAVIVNMTWPIADPRILLLVVAAFGFSAFVFMSPFRDSASAHTGATVFHALAIGAVLLLPLPAAAAIIILLATPGLVMR